MLNLTKDEALEKSRKIFEEWNKALLSESPEKVAELYTESNMFLPTMSGDFKFGKIGDVEYFEHFLVKHPHGKIIEDDVRVGDKFIVHAGFYNFEVDGGGDGREVVEARFTFVYEKNDVGDWKIVHHHSSLKPVNV